MSTAAPAFDPYREWLGIEPHEQPADFYRLLGVAKFETDLARIATAADQRMALVRSFQVGPRGVYTQRLLNELSAARIALLSPASKAAYDAALSRYLVARIAAAAASSPTSGASAVLTFGLVETPAQPALPVLPPAVLRVAPQSVADEAHLEPARPAPWWREMLLLVGVPVLVLAAVIGWGLGRPYFNKATSDPGGVAAPSAKVEPAPKPIPKPKPPPEPLVLLQEGSGEIVFSAATATRSGAVELQVVGTEEVLTSWTGKDDSVQWRFKLVRPGFFQAEIVYATIPSAGDAAIELVIGEQPMTLDLRISGGLDRFITDTVTLLVPTNGEQTLVIRPAHKPDGDWFVLKSVRLIPVDREKPMEATP